MAELIEKKFLGQDAAQRLVEQVKSRDAETLRQAKEYADGLADNYDAAGTAATKVNELANGQVKTNTEAIGNRENLETTNKADLVQAINEVRNAVSAGGTAAAITLETNSNPGTEGVATAYTIKQGDNVVGTINIPKDMVVKSGEVVTNPEGQAEGTYLKLTLANATSDVIYINVGTLVDIYKAKANATQVQLAIDSATREISATIVAGSITATELAANAVTTEKIADGNVTKAKLSTAVQESLGKADVAEKNAKDYADGLNTAMDTRVKSAEEALKEGGSVDTKIGAAKQEAINTAAGDATTKANKALEDANSYTDTELGKLNTDLSADIKQNADDIDAIETSLATGGATANAIADAKKAGTDAQTAVTNLTNGEVANLRSDVDTLKSVSYVAITADEIDAMFEA